MAEAKAKIVTAESKLNSIKTKYNQLLLDQKTIQSQIDTAQINLNTKATALTQAQQDILKAQQDLANAQTDYNTQLISDPDWIRPTKEIQVSEQVAYTVLVPHTTTVTTTTLVPRTVTTVIPAGLVAESYNMFGYNSSPPLPDQSSLVATTKVDNINFDWGGGAILNSGLFEDVAVRFSGNINIPTTNTYTFYAPGDDGVIVIIDGNTIINDWYDKGGGGSIVSVPMTEGSHSITVWYYENGGGANVWLYWIIPESPGWEIIPASAFGEQVIQTIVYDEVTTTTEVTTYTEEIAYKTVWHTEVVPDDSLSAPLIKDPALLEIVNQKQATLDNEIIKEQNAKNEFDAAQFELNTLINNQSINTSEISSTYDTLTTYQNDLATAQSQYDAIQPYIEPTIDPPAETVTPIDTQIIEEQKQLEERAVINDTKVLPYTLADVKTEQQAEQVLEVLSNPGELVNAVGESLQQATEFINNLVTDPQKTFLLVANQVSNAGLDMSDDQREKAQEVIIPVVIVSQIASTIIGRIK